MNTSRADEFAVLFVTELAKRKSASRISLSKIATIHGVSVLYMKKIVRALKKTQLVNSKEGAGGGYALNRSSRKISVWDVIESVSAKKLGLGVLHKENCPLNKSCLPQHINIKINESIENSLRLITIRSLI